MTIPYVIRLVCLSLACFFLFHLVVGTILAALAPAAIRMAERTEARRAAGFVFALRLVPTTAAGFVVAALCVPSYIWLEPNITSEGVGFTCLAAAMLGATVWGISIARSSMAMASSARFLRDCLRSASRTNLPGHVSPVWIIEEKAPLVVALAGVVRPQLVISRQVLDALSPEQLELTLRHERAHRISYDNLKRLVLILAPDLFPFVNPLGALERSWARFAEWAADDAAAGGDPQQSLSLAATLVSVARAGSWPRPSPLVASLVGSGTDLAVRVERLLDPAASGANVGRRISLLAAAWIGLLACATVILAVEPSVLSFVHGILERLIA